MTSASDDAIVEFARRERRAVFTADFDFADVRRYPPSDYSGIVVFALNPTDTRDSILAIVSGFLTDVEVVRNLEGRLVIVERGRLRIQPPVD